MQFHICKKNGGGSIINTTSMAAFNGDFMRTTYGSSKAGVVSLTRYVAAQYGKQNIRCNAVAPRFDYDSCGNSSCT